MSTTSTATLVQPSTAPIRNSSAPTCHNCGASLSHPQHAITQDAQQRISELETQVKILTGKATAAGKSQPSPPRPRRTAHPLEPATHAKQASANTGLLNYSRQTRRLRRRAAPAQIHPPPAPDPNLRPHLRLRDQPRLPPLPPHKHTQRASPTPLNRHRPHGRPHQYLPPPKPALLPPHLPPLDVPTPGLGAPPRRPPLHPDRNRPPDGADPRASTAAGGGIEPVADE